MTETTNHEQVVMTPKCKTANSTVLIIERKSNSKYIGNGKVHVAGGDHTGIVINKEISAENAEALPPKLTLEFRVFLISGQTGKHTQESRILRYWFRVIDNKYLLNNTEEATVAQEFFKELVSPQEFPRDYVGFIKKIMKLMQHKYDTISKLEIELRQLEETTVPTRPMSADENSLENGPQLSEEKVLELIESSYPNPLTINEMTQKHSWDKDEVIQHMHVLEKRGLVKAMDHGAYTRQQSIDNRVTIVKQMPTISSAKQPTIAVITAQYCEKLAVDAMIENKTTYVRYTTVGTCTSPGEAPKPKFVIVFMGILLASLTLRFMWRYIPKFKK